MKCNIQLVNELMYHNSFHILHLQVQMHKMHAATVNQNNSEVHSDPSAQFSQLLYTDGGNANKHHLL